MIIGIEKSGKSLETVMMSWKMQMSITLLMTHTMHLLIFLQFMTQSI